MQNLEKIVFLFDCDNTLLDNDCFQDELSAQLERELGAAARDRYWQSLEELRAQQGYVDYLGALQRLRIEMQDNPRLLQSSSFLLDYPFELRLYPGALAALSHCRQWGRTVILSDGDAVFQPRKLQRSGVWGAVDGRVLIYIHKEQMLYEMAQHYPAHHYVMVDDKLRILAAMKRVLKDQLTTVFVRQGHYALDVSTIAQYPPADLTVDHIGDLCDCALPSLFGVTTPQPMKK